MDPLEPSSTSDEVTSIISSGGPLPHVNFFGIFFVGSVVITWPHTSTPTPKNIHHNHCSSVRAAVAKATPPYWTIITCAMDRKRARKG